MLNSHFLRAHPAHFIALGFGSGLSRFAPGTAGTLWAWATFVLLQIFLTPLQMGWLIAASFVVGWWACTVCAQHLGVADPGAIVWDEVVAFWLILWLVTPTSFGGELAAFVLFRYFDAAKASSLTAWPRAAGAADLASCLTMWWPRFALCW